MFLFNFLGSSMPLILAGGGETDFGGFFSLVVMLALIVGIFYFLVVRPQKQQKQQRQEMINNLRKGQRIVTAGGIHGQVTSISENTVKINVAKDIKLIFNKASIMMVKGEEDEA